MKSVIIGIMIFASFSSFATNNSDCTDAIQKVAVRSMISGMNIERLSVSVKKGEINIDEFSVAYEAINSESKTAIKEANQACLTF